MLYDFCPCESGKKFKYCCHEYYVDIVKATQKNGTIKIPVLDCYVGRNIDQTGIAYVIVTRGFSYEYLLAGIYLVDIWCLGVKDTYLTKFKSKEVFDNFYFITGSATAGLGIISYEKARNIILGSIQYAAALEFLPQGEWQITKHMLETERPFKNTFKFGRDGKPFYCAGPYDSKVCDNYIKKVEKHGGNWVIPGEFDE